MDKYMVIKITDGRERIVYEGTLDPDIISGRHTAQFRPFGHCYYMDGRVLRSDDDRRRVPGVKCRFEKVAA